MPAILAPARHRVLQGANTPAVLRRFIAAIALLAVLAGGLSLWEASDISGIARTVGRDAEPSVTLALRMARTLGDMDAAALADALVDGGAATGTSNAFRSAELSLGADMVEAARNVTYGEAEAGPLRDLLRWTLAYQEAVAEARTYGAGNAAVTSRREQWASRLNRDFAVPAAATLAAANAKVLEEAYGRYEDTTLLLGAAAVLGFALLVAGLLAVQAWLARRMRRTLNPLLAAATVVAASAGLWFGSAVLAERAHLHTAKVDAYDSLRELFGAEAAASALRADGSAWLGDPTIRRDVQARLDAAARALADADLADPTTVGNTQTKLATAQREEDAGHPGSARSLAPHLGGFLGKELDNVTFGPNERRPASDSVLRLVDALAALHAMQALEARREHTAAVAQWLDPAVPAGGVNAFAALRQAIDDTIKVNQDAFNREVDAALETARLLPVASGTALLLVVVLASGGLWLRLREYR